MAQLTVRQLIDALQKMPPDMGTLIPMRPAESSKVMAIGYDPDSETFAVRFEGKSGPRTYRYGGVALELASKIFNEAERGGSVGSMVYTELVRPKGPYRQSAPWEMHRTEDDRTVYQHVYAGAERGDAFEVEFNGPGARALVERQLLDWLNSRTI